MAIVENKRLSEIFAWIKDRQDDLRPPKDKTNSKRTGYREKGRTGVAVSPSVYNIQKRCLGFGAFAR
jgi:hypothetical protein